MSIIFTRASFRMVEVVEMRKGRCHRGGVENLSNPTENGERSISIAAHP
jgi:hypothetical protein